METLLSFLAFGVLIAIMYYIGEGFSKGFYAVATVVNKNILFKPEHQEGLKLVSEPLSFNTKSSMKKIISSLAVNVTTAPLPLGIKNVLYQMAFNKDVIAYAFGNKFHPKHFIAMVTFLEKEGGETNCVFKVTNWHESNGLLVERDSIRKLRKQVQAAFTALENPIQLEVAGDAFCEKCGIKNLGSAKFCKDCGSKI